MAGTTISTLAAKLILDNGKFISGFKQSGKAAKGFNLELNQSAIGLGKLGSLSLPPALGIGLTALSVAAAVLAAEAAVAATVVSVLYGRMQDLDKQAKTAAKLGIGFEDVQKLGIAARASGTNLDVLAKAMLHMGRTIGSGDKGMANQFFKVAAEIAAIEDPALRSARAWKILGKVGDELMPLLLGASGIHRSARAIDRLGLSLSRLDVKKVEQANDAITVLAEVWRAFLDKAAVEAAPAFMVFAEEMLLVIEKLAKAGKELGADWELVGDIFTAVGGIILQMAAHMQVSTDAVIVLVRALETLITIMKEAAAMRLGDFRVDFEAIKKQLDAVNAAARQLDKSLFDAVTGKAMFDFFKKVAEAREGLGKEKLGGAGGLGGGPVGKPVKPGALEKNTVEAVRAVQAAGGDPLSAIKNSTAAALRVLKSIDANLDPMKAPGKGKLLVLRESPI